METQAEQHQPDLTARTGETSSGTTDARIIDNLTFTDADMSDHGGSSDLGGGRVGGDVAEDFSTGVTAGDDDVAEEDEAFVTAAVDDGADLAVPDNSATDVASNQ
jgi:hypothetical protein